MKAQRELNLGWAPKVAMVVLPEEVGKEVAKLMAAAMVATGDARKGGSGEPRSTAEDRR